MSQLQSWLGPVAEQLGTDVMRVAELIAPLAHLALGREDAVHRAQRAEVALLVEQAGVDLGRSQVDEARLVQDLDHHRALRARARARRLPLGLHGRPRRTPAVVARPRHAEGVARRRNAETGGNLHRGMHQRSSSLLGIGRPRSCATFFWTSTKASARSARARSRVHSCSSSAMRRSRLSRACGFGPRLRGVSPASSPRSRIWRQCVRIEEYSPSRRSSAPISPGFVQASASRRMRRLYFAVNRRSVVGINLRSLRKAPYRTVQPLPAHPAPAARPTGWSARWRNTRRVARQQLLQNRRAYVE